MPAKGLESKWDHMLWARMSWISASLICFGFGIDSSVRRSRFGKALAVAWDTVADSHVQIEQWRPWMLDFQVQDSFFADGHNWSSANACVGGPIVGDGRSPACSAARAETIPRCHRHLAADKVSTFFVDLFPYMFQISASGLRAASASTAVCVMGSIVKTLSARTSGVVPGA